MQLVDAHLASDPAKYLSALLLALGAMLHLELPHVNVLSKVRGEGLGLGAKGLGHKFQAWVPFFQASAPRSAPHPVLRAPQVGQRVCGEAGSGRAHHQRHLPGNYSVTSLGFRNPKTLEQ